MDGRVKPGQDTELPLPRLAPRQRSTHQRAVGAFGQCLGHIEAEPRQAFAVGSVHGARQTLPQHRWQTLRRALRVLQQLQRWNQPLLHVGKIAAERKRRQQAGFARGLQRSCNPIRVIVAVRRRYFKLLRQLAGVLGLPRPAARVRPESANPQRPASPRSHRRRIFP